MFHINDVHNYVYAELSGLPIDFSESSVIASVHHCQGDEVSIICRLKGSDLMDAVDLYIKSTFIESPQSLTTLALSKKIKSLLSVYDQLAYEEIRIEGKHYASSLVELEPIVDEILAHSNDSSQRSGYDLVTYNNLMQVDGEVHIARFALQKFWDTEFNAFVEYLQEYLSDSLRRAYETFSSISLAFYSLSDYEYSRRINNGLTLTITLEEEDHPLDLVDCYMDEETLPSGEVIQKRNDETIINIFNNVADESYVPALMYILFTDEDGAEISSSYMNTYASKGKDGKVKISDRTILLREAFHELKEKFTPDTAQAA